MGRLHEIELRLSEISEILADEKRAEKADIDALETEVNSLKEERAAIQDAAEKRSTLLSSLAGGEEGETVRDFRVPEMRTTSTYGQDSPEYRSAFFKNLLHDGIGEPSLTELEKRAFTHTTVNTPQVLPINTLNMIWDLITEKHTIMSDLKIYRTGTIMRFIKHIDIKAGKAKTLAEDKANDDEENTFVTVDLNGKDFSKHVIISYAMAKMSIDAFEAYLVNEIANELGRVLAEDIIKQIKSDVDNANKITSATASFAYKDFPTAFSNLKRVGNVVMYTNYKTFYSQIVSIVDTTGRPIFQPNAQAGALGTLLGATVKIEEALADGEVLIGDPQRVVYSMVQDIMIESDRDIKKHVIIHSGYARGEGVLIDSKSFVVLTPKSGPSS